MGGQPASAPAPLPRAPAPSWRCSYFVSLSARAGGAADGARPFLKELVERLCSAACYGIQWVHEGGVLRFGGHYNPQWRIEGVRRQGLKGLYTLNSKAWTFAEGEGLIGKAFAEQAVLFVEDLQ